MSNFRFQHPGGNAGDGLHLNPSFHDAVLNDPSIARVDGAATGSIGLRGRPQVISFMPDAVRPDIGVAFTKNVISEDDIARLHTDVRLRFGYGEFVRLAGDGYSAEHSHLLARPQSAELSTLGPPRRIYGRTALDWPIGAAVG